MSDRFCILDCYVDEPACLGVPPFISPYPRYIYGALTQAGVDETRIDYRTIDALRENEYRLEADYKIVFLIGGAVVPGRYLGSRIGSLAEIRRITETNKKQRFAIGGLISRVMDSSHNAHPIGCDIEKFAHGFALDAPLDARRTPLDIAAWSVPGARVVRHHPRFPNVICEIETYRGCPRTSHCSFCAEGAHGALEFRQVEDIIAEVDALIREGVSRFRLGRQADILQYKTEFTDFKNGFPKPRTGPILELLSALEERKSRGLIKILNVDNANPGTIVHFPDESSEILQGIVRAVTPGDTLALGIESFDSNVVAANNLKVSAGEAFAAIEFINKIGGIRSDSIPVLLPGVNLLHGLTGETPNTFEENFRWLEKVRDSGLLIKRINIRKVLPFPGTPLYNSATKGSRTIENRFTYYRGRIRAEIEHIMLQKIYPAGTVLRDNEILETRAGYSYGKQIASYSITTKFPLQLPEKNFYDAVVIGHRERSLLALPDPIPINTLPQKAIELVPGIGKRRAVEIILGRPFNTMADILKMTEGVSELIKRRFSI